MLKVLRANDGAGRGSILAKGLLELSAAAGGRKLAAATGRSRRSKRRRSGGELAQESLEQRQLLAVTTYAEAGINGGWATIVAEPGDSVFVQQVAGPANLQNGQSLWVANNSSFLNRTVVGGANKPNVQYLNQLLPGVDALSLSNLTITTGTPRRDDGLLATAYPMLTPYVTGVTLPANEPGSFDLNYRLSGTISIVEPDGTQEQWTFDSYSGRAKWLTTGIGTSKPASAGQYYPTSVTAAGNQIQITWNAAQLPATPTVSYQGVIYSSWYGSRGVSHSDAGPAAPAFTTILLPNAVGQGLNGIIPSTFSAELTVDGNKFHVTTGGPSSTVNTLLFDGQAVGSWEDGYPRYNDRSIQGVLLTGAPLSDGTSPRGLQLRMNNNYAVELDSVAYSVATGGAPVTAYVWAGQDITAALNVNLLSPGSSVSVDSRVSSATNPSGGISLRATNVTLNAPATTSGVLTVGSAVGDVVLGLEQAQAVAAVIDGKVTQLTIPSGWAGAGYDYRPGFEPKVTLSAPEKKQAIASLISLTAGVVQSISVTAPGSGYTAAPTVTLSSPGVAGGQTATATASFQDGKVSAFVLTNVGKGYVVPPTVTVRADTGSGASGKAVIVGSIGTGSILITNRGAGYEPGSQFAITISSGSGGTGASGYAVIDGNGFVDHLEITNGGSGYSLDTTTITIPTPNGTKPPETAEATAIVDPATTRIVGFRITKAGDGYGETPTVTIAAPQVAYAALRPASVVNGGQVASISLQSGSGLSLRVAGVTPTSGAVATVSVVSGGGGTGYAVGDILNISSQSTGAGQSAQFQVLEVDGSGAVRRIATVFGGSGYKQAEILQHDGKASRGYGYTAAPRVWIERPSAPDGRQATAHAVIDQAGRVTGIVMDDKGSGYTTVPAVTIESLLPFAQAETVRFNAALAAKDYSILLNDDRATATDRSTLYVSRSSSLAATIPAAPGLVTTPAHSVVIESHRGDVVIAGVINAAEQSYLLQSDPRDVMLFPYRFTTLGDSDWFNIQGGKVAMTLANDLPTAISGGAASNELTLRTAIDSIRVRAAGRSGVERTDPFPYTLSVIEQDNIAIDALAASGSPLLLSAGGDMRFNAAINTADNLQITGVKGLSVSAPISVGKNAIFEAQEVVVDNTLDARNDVIISSSNGDITLSGGRVTAGRTARIVQKNKRAPLSHEYTADPSQAIVVGKTTSIPINVADAFVLDDVNVTLSITNPNLSYLSASLVSPAGVEVPLFYNYTLAGASMKTAVFNDQASKRISDGTAPYTTLPADTASEKGFQPVRSLADFNNAVAAGTWTLKVTSPYYGSAGTVDSVSLTIRDPIGGSTGQVLMNSLTTIAADTLVVDAEGSVQLNTDANTVTAVVGQAFTLADEGAVNIVSLRAGGAVSLKANGVDQVDPAGKTATVAALQAAMADVGSISVSAPNGSIDVQVTAADSIQLGNIAQFNGIGMQAAGSVKIRSLGGSSGGDIAAIDAPLAGSGARQVRLATTSKLDKVSYVSGTPGLYSSTLTSTGNESLASRFPAGTPAMQVGDRILVTNGTETDGDKTNGVYTVSDLGGGARQWRLIRSIDCDTAAELPSGSIVHVNEGEKADVYYRITYQTAGAQLFGLAAIGVQEEALTTNIGSDDSTDRLRFVTSTTAGTNNSAGSLGKMIRLAQTNDTSASLNRDQKTEMLFSSAVISSIQLLQELPLIEKPLVIDGASRWDSAKNVPVSGTAIGVDGSRIATSRIGAPVSLQAVVNGFQFTKTSGGTNSESAGRLTNMNIGGFNQGSAVIIDSGSNVTIDRDKIGFGLKGDRLGNQYGVIVQGQAAGVTISNSQIGNSGKVGVSLRDSASGVTLFGDTIGSRGSDNLVGVEVLSSQPNFIGNTARARNVIDSNYTGVKLGVGSGSTTIENSEISGNADTGITIFGGSHTIGASVGTLARNAIFANAKWGILIDGGSQDTKAALAASQTIRNNSFISPAAAIGDNATQNRIGLKDPAQSQPSDYSNTNTNYQPSQVTGADSFGNTYVAVADAVGPALTVQEVRSTSNAVITSRPTADGLAVSGTSATQVRKIVLHLTDDGSGLAEATVVKGAFSLSKDGAPLTEGTDYTWSYSRGPVNEVVFTCAGTSGLFALGRYAVTATGRAGTSTGSSPVTGGNLTDNSNNPVQGNTTDPSLVNVARFTIVLADVPATVRGVQATVGDRAVSLTWAAPSSPTVPITNYIVEYLAGGGNWQRFPHDAFTATNLQVTGLTNGVAYSFRVAAVNDAGQGSFSEATSAVTPRSLPSYPLNLQAVAGNASATLTWALPSSDGGSSILDYVVQSSRDGVTTWQTFNDGLSTTRTAVVTGLTNGTTYSFRVAATTAAGQGAWAVSTPVTPAALPTAALNVVATAGDSQAILTWAAPTSTGGASIVDYAVQKSSDGGTTWADVTDGVSTANTATVTGLVNGTAYVFHVAALNGAGTGPYSVASAAITPRVLPSAPLNLQAEAGDGLAILTWTAPASAGSAPVLDYLVQSSGDNGVTWTTVNDGTSTATTATVAGLTNGAGYLFRVAAVSAAGQGSWATVSNGVTPVGLPSVPTNVAAAVANGQAVLTWSSPTNTGGLAIVDYVIQSSSNGGATWITLNDDVTGVTGLTVPNLTNGIAYIFRVAAVNSFGAGEFSDATAPQTSLAAPQAITNLIAVASARSVTLTWNAPASDGGRPVIDYAIDYHVTGSADWIRWNHAPSAATYAIVTGLALGRGYAFRVTAVTDYGSSVATESAGLVVCMNAPTRVTGRALNGAVSLGWVAPRPPAGTRTINYQIQYSTNSGATWTTVLRPASALPRATVGGLQNGRAYVFRVAAVTTVGVGAYSANSAILRPGRR